MPLSVRQRAGLQEVHIAILGMDGVGKSALAVKYITRRFITEYDPHLEDTYCKHEVINDNEYMLWIMDTVESGNRDTARYLSWADVFIVVYSITSLQSLKYAESLLTRITQREHSLTLRNHCICLVGTKSDMERYRQVSKTDAQKIADTYGALFYETCSTEQFALVKPIFHESICESIKRKDQVSHKRSPSPRNYSSDSEMQTHRRVNTKRSNSNSPMITSLVMRRTKSPNLKHSDSGTLNAPSVPPGSADQSPMGTLKGDTQQTKKSNTGLKLFKLFQISGNTSGND